MFLCLVSSRIKEVTTPPKINEKGIIKAQLAEDLDRLTKAGIPVDVVFEQGVKVLGI